MGAEPYCYITKYRSNIQEALDHLRAEEFKAGRYYPCFETRTGKSLYEFGLIPRSEFPSPGPCHETIEAVYGQMDENGTQSILDIAEASDAPISGQEGPGASLIRMDISGVASPVNDDDLQLLLGTTKPTAQLVQDILLAKGESEPRDVEKLKARDRFWDGIGRADARYIVLYRDGEPDGIFFAGFSAD